MTFNQAQSYCRSYHSDLASAKDATETSIVYLPASINKWMGLSRITWKWLDQTNTASLNWYPGQPDNYLAFEDCGYLSKFLVADAQCATSLPFFCHGSE